jgi:hypothetical protein
MSARGTARQIAAKAGMLLGALFVFTLLLAALPAHRAPAQEGSAAQSPEVDHRGMAGMDVGDEHASEKAAVRDMTPGHHDAHIAHMPMTAIRTQTPEDFAARQRSCGAASRRHGEISRLPRGAE